MHNVFLILVEPIHSLVQALGQLVLGKIDKGAIIFIYTLLPPLVGAGLRADGIFAQPIQESIVGYPVEPGRELAAALETIQGGPHLQKRLLGQIFGIVSAATKTSQICKDVSVVNFQQFAGGIFICLFSTPAQTLYLIVHLIVQKCSHK
jgi:hypothetical protein